MLNCSSAESRSAAIVIHVDMMYISRQNHSQIGSQHVCILLCCFTAAKILHSARVNNQGRRSHGRERRERKRAPDSSIYSPNSSIYSPSTDGRSISWAAGMRRPSRVWILVTPSRRMQGIPKQLRAISRSLEDHLITIHKNYYYFQDYLSIANSRLATTLRVMSATRIRWGDALDDDDEGSPKSVLPPSSVSGPDARNVKTYTDYRYINVFWFDRTIWSNAILRLTMRKLRTVWYPVSHWTPTLCTPCYCQLRSCLSWSEFFCLDNLLA